jgi:SpoVK/Ycf46/Vps4 family AAA+-type ATPase
MNALRRDINAKEVTFSDFEKAMEEVPPSISPEIEKWYRSFMNQVRKLQKSASFVV